MGDTAVSSGDIGSSMTVMPVSGPAPPPLQTQGAAVDWISPASSNLTSPNLQDLPLDSNFAWLLCALILAMTWIIYITYYNSRVVGFLLTKLINRFIGHGYLKIGSFSVSVLSGKVMFRDIAYITVDYSLRVQDGWMKFRWWKKYIKRSVTEDLSHSDTRMSLLLNGFELHVYNRSSVYARLERLLGLDPQFFPPDAGCDPDDKKGGGGSAQDMSASSRSSVDELLEWRDLIPVIKVDISCGRVVFGNRLLPTSLLINVEEAHLVYTTKPASSRADQFMHIVKCKAENFKVILATSPRYTGMDDEPPRFMGEGFVVLQSNGVDLYYYMDEAGVVSDEPEMVELADGLIVHEITYPVWGLDIKCGKGTDFSYGPWADRQREHLFKFFFPQDYQPLAVTKIAAVGERRQFRSFDIRLSTLADATIDLLFSKDKETMAVHMNVKPGSYLEMTIPWIITEEGYSTKINGQLMHLDASTSLQYRTLAESETLEFEVRAKYPVIWNDQQQWKCQITGCKATANLIYEHKSFFQDLVADWSSKSKPDLLHFVPYSWHFNLMLKEFEIILPCNQHNWIDCSSQHEENSYLAFCGELFDLSVDLPFVDFLPPILPIKIWIQGECVDLAMYLPEANTSRNIVHAIDKTCKLTRRDGSAQNSVLNERKWRNKTKRCDGWIDCWSVPIVALSITYAYHPNPAVTSPRPDPDITTPEKEELLLNPIRPPTGHAGGRGSSRTFPAELLRPRGFDPTILAPDQVSLELEVGPSVLRLYGPLLRNFMNVKENYFGADQSFNDLDTSSKNAAAAAKRAVNAFDEAPADSEFDPRMYRPLAVTVSITMHDIQAHLLRNCADDDPPCPSVYLERLGFEMHKTYMETQLQLLLSPVLLSVTDAVARPDQHRHLQDGHLALSGLQVRGHAMFSDDGLGLDEETLEYAWLVEIQFGHFTGRLTAPQLHNIATCLETFVLLVEDAENSLQSPYPHRLCHHGVGQPHCADTKPNLFCPTSDDVKYRMTRLSVESINLFLVEAGSALNILVHPIRFSTCNLHGSQTDSGHTALVDNLRLRQYMVTGSTSKATSSVPSLPGGGVGSSSANDGDQPPADVWLEVGAVELGPVYLDSISASRHPDIHALQDAFLRTHDARTLRLWFLWPLERCPLPPALGDSCGCRGACHFFGTNHYGHSVRSCEARASRDAGHPPQQQPRPPTSSGAVDPGYGQSLLHEGQLIFDVLLPNGGGCPTVSPNLDTGGRFVFTRGYMNQPTPMTSRDVSEHSLAGVLHHPIPKSTAVSSPPPPVQRAFSHPATAENVVTIPVNSSSMVSFPAAERPAEAATTPVLRKGAAVVVPPPAPPPGRGHHNHQGRATSVTSLQRVPSSPGGSAPGGSVESPTRERQNSSSSSRQSLNGHPGGGGAASPRGSSFRHVRRTTSIGAESVQSLDVFYPAEDEPTAARARSPERRASNLEMRRSELVADGSCQSLLQTVIEIPQASSTDDKESNSVSSTSFISALSSQEDLALVDLHVQLDKPIIDSPLLMFAYNSHMTRLTSSHWYERPPLPHYTHQPMERAKQQEYWGAQWVPHFFPLSEGFTGIKVVEAAERSDTAPPAPPCPPSPSHCPFPWDIPVKLRDELAGESDFDEATGCDSNVSKTTMIVKLEGTVSIYISPLMLEASQHFVEAVTPALSSLHPSTITNHLHARCVSAVQDANQLKKDKYMYVSHLRDWRHRSTDSEGHSVHHHHPRAQAAATSATHSGSVYEETHTSRLQVFVSVSKINLSILQASISEEMTSFSALDNLRDVTCVSLLILNLSQLSGRLLTSTQSRKSIQTLQVGGAGGPSASAAAAARRRRSKGGAGSKKSASGGKTDWFPPEPVAVETSEMQQEELVATLDFKRIHTQLRRLPNSSSILREAALTAVPRHRSKVFFGYEQPSYTNITRPIPTTAADGYQDAFGIGDPMAELEERMGFIMFECGLEGFDLRAVKRAGFDVSSPASSRGESGMLSSDDEVFGVTKTPKHQQRPASSLSMAAGAAQPAPGKGESSPTPSGQPTATKVPSRETGSTAPTGDGFGAGTAPDASEGHKAATGHDALADASSCVIDFRTVWFNFAAPPHMPNTQKIDYTRLDWHLLSTATPAINSWLNPSNRLLVSVQNMAQSANLRQVSVLACLMAEALDAQELHLPVRGKYSRLTPLSKTLREDPSCQLLNVLQRYLNMSSLASLEETLRGPLTPQLPIIHKGLIALGRQWKNVLYMPGLLERNIKMQQRNPRPPFNISFAVPLIESSSGGKQHNANTTEEEEDDDDDEDYDEIDASAEEATDETRLLRTGAGSASTDASGTGGSSSSNRAGSSSLCGMELGGAEELGTGHHQHERRRHQTASGGTAAATLPKKKKRLPNFQQPRSSCASVALPMLPGGSLDSYYRRSGMTTPVQGTASPGITASSTTRRGFLIDGRQNASNQTLRSAGPSLGSLDSAEHHQHHQHHQHHHHHHHRRRVCKEDLYAWMSRRGTDGPTADADPLLQGVQGDGSRGDTLGSCDTRASGSAAFAGPPSAAFSLAPLAAQLADAHVLFNPLLTCLGVPSQIGSSSLGQRFGPNFSVRAALELFKIDIVETEGKPTTGGSGGRQRLPSQTRFFVSTDSDMPAFQCERLCVELDLREVQDLERAKTEGLRSFGAASSSMSGGTGSGGQQNLIYAKMDGFRKHNTVAINFCVNVYNVCQQVNLPLLRLLHQFSTMYQNARETQLELMEKRPHFSDPDDASFRSHKKNDSSGSESQAGGGTVGQEPVVTAAGSIAPSTASGQPIAGDHLHPNIPVTTGITRPSAATVDTILRRPQTLTQRLRASTRGYTNLSGGGGGGGGSSPLSSNVSDVAVEADVSDRVTEQTKAKTPRCWRTMYYLLDLYATMPETKTITNRSPVAPPDVSDGYKGNGKYEQLKEHRIDMTEAEPVTMRARTFSHDRLKHLRASLMVKERVPLVVFGVVKIRCTRILATLSGLKLEAELGNLQASHTRKEKVQGSSKRWTETSATGYLGRATVVLLEGTLPNQQTIVKATVGKSQALYSGHSKRAKEKNSALITIGPINVDIPQHPVALHGMMTRSTKQLSTTLQELRTPRVPTRYARASDEADVGSTRSPRPSVESTAAPSSSTATAANRTARPALPTLRQQKLLHPIVVHFSIILDSLTIGASLLPSLRAQYQMGQVTSIGVTGSKAKFTVDLPKHSLSFTTKVQLSEVLPSSASVDLPPVHLSAEYVQQGIGGVGRGGEETVDLHFVDGAVLRKGSYLSAVADLGAFEHSLTTDLLNHLVFVQKVFMKEINEVVQKMSGGDKPVRLWSAEGKTSAPAELLYSVQLRLKGIQITATTPTNSAVRLETGVLQLQLSNRVQNLSGSAGTSSSSAAKLFGKAHVELNVSLGQLIRNALFEEAEPEFQQVAYFKTSIALRNALQDEMVSTTADDKEAVLITLYRPLIYILPVALDKAVIVWLNYKNAYEYWNEQRSSLNKEVLTATQQVLEKVPPIAHLGGAHGLSTLFLQLTINDMGICLPLSPYTSVFNISRATYDSEPRAACVVTLESTRISACSSGSLVSKGRFSGLCIRFADDFETSLDDWKPDPNDPSIMNLCVVSEGTYEICSRTVVQQGLDNAKWILNVLWEMEGVAIHVDTNIGKQLSALAHTLTSLAGSSQDAGEGENEGRGPDGLLLNGLQNPVTRKGSTLADGLYGFVLDPNMDAKKRSRLIEREMNEQAKIVNDLKLLGASHSTIEQETRILQELETAVFNDFRRDVIKRLRRQSMKASSIKEKFGILSRHSKPTQATPAPTPEKMALSNIISPQGFSPSSSSQASSPSHGHARTTSLDSARVTFSSDTSVRHYGIDLSLGEKWPSADTMDPSQLYAPPIATLTAGNLQQQQQQQTPSVTTTTESSPITTTTPSELLSDIEQGSLGVNSTPSPSEAVEPETQFERPIGLTLGSLSSRQALLEPNIDFELDVKVFINSGKCVLHTKDFREEELRLQKGIGRERSFSSSTFDFPMSPGHRKRSGNVRSNPSAAKLKFLPAPPTLTSEFTVFLIPGLDVKVHYNSRTECGESGAAPPTNTTTTGVRFSFAEDQVPHDAHSTGPAGPGRKTGMKRASLFAWMTLQSIPEETVITPHILDFLEKALEPIPLPLPQPKGHMKDNDVTAAASSEMGFSGDTSDPLAASQAAPAAYASFPVDVIVYLRIQPSTLRFSCLPISRVECLLRLPSLDLVISTKRAEGELSGEFRDPWPPRTTPYGLADMYLTQAAVGGLSVTACLEDFSVYIFHPYTGGKNAGSHPGSNKDLSGEASPLTGSSDRKDALSVQLEFVKVNLSRSRKVNLGLEQSTQSNKPGRSSAEQFGGAVIRFSTICDIGSASFKYDMRRLTEILAFPKAWYRRTIVRRLFLGDQSSTIFGSDQEDSGSSAGSSLSPSSVSSKGDVMFAFNGLNLSDTNVGAEAPLQATSVTSPTAGTTNSTSALDALLATPRAREKQKQRLTLDLPKGASGKSGASASMPTSPMLDGRLAPSSRNPGDPPVPSGSRKSSILPTPLYASKAGSSWETLVLFAVNLSKLNIHMNMGNVMGNTIWTTRGLQSQGRLSIGSSGHKNMFMSIGLGGSSLDAKGGIVGGTIELSQVDTYLHIKEDPGQEPEHRLGVKLFALESRLDYMGTSVFMGRVSSLDVTLRDEWRVHNLQTTPTEGDLPTKRPALIFIHGDLAWDQLQIMISKSTTPDLLKMHIKLEEFFAQQFHSSKRVLSSLQPSAQDGSSANRRAALLSRKASSAKAGSRGGATAAGAAGRQVHTPLTGKKPRPQVTGETIEPRHHRHWQRILGNASGLKLPTLLAPLPKHGTILGGTMELHGNNISLACFHGINFRAKSWALFSLKEPNISFATEAQDVVNLGSQNVDTHIVQNLSFTLGHNITEHTRHVSMATVCRISRNFVFPPQFRSMHEWFHYAFVTSDLDEVDRFPGLERERRDSFSQQERQPRLSPKAQDCNHTMEMIFALPCLQLHLKTEHLQTETTPVQIDHKPLVECSFITEFEDHIFVAVDAEAFFFLHDLITAYIKEKDRGTLGTPAGHPSKSDKNVDAPAPDKEVRFKVSETTETLQKDWRNYECKTWHLEPTVRLMSWAGKRIEPYGVDYILQKLGFSHARVTIPKWMQRGAMDPLDKVLAVLMDKMVNALRDGGENKTAASESGNGANK